MADTEDSPFAGLTITKDMTFEQILELARKEYGYIDTIFQTVPELKKLLRKAVKNKYQAKQFQQEFTSTNWFISTGDVMQKRGFEMRQYDEMVNQINSKNPGKTPEEIAGLVAAQLPDSNYARGIESVKNAIKAQAVSKNLKYTEDELSTWAKEIYNGGHETDANFIKIYLNTKGTFGIGADATGVGAANINAIRDYAGSQGFDLEKDFSAATMQGWQQRLDMGESLAAIRKEIETRAMIGQPTSVQNLMSSQGFELDKDFDATKIQSWQQRLDMGESVAAIRKEIETRAMIGQPPSVQNLMKQGLNLTDIYSPFVERAKNRTGSMSISMKDDWFGKNIFDEKGELVNYFEFDKRLMKHPDWEYGPEAKEKVSSSALRILQDMGLMG